MAALQAGSERQPAARADGLVRLDRLLGTICDEEHAMEGATGRVALHVSLQPTRMPAGAAAWLGVAFRDLLRVALRLAALPGASGHVGVHLWTARLPGAPCFLVVAGDRDATVTDDAVLAPARHALGAAGTHLLHEPGLGAMWRIRLP